MLKLKCAEHAFLVVATLTVAPCTGGVFSGVRCDTSALPSDKRFVSDLVVDRIEKRTPPSGRGGGLTVRFVLNPSIQGENAVIAVKGSAATVTAGRFVGIVQGAGALLRRIRYGRETFSLEDGEFSFKPAKGFRMAYLARHFQNWYHHATADEMCGYIDDLVLAGYNGFDFQIAYPTADRAVDTADEMRRFLEVSAKALDRVHALDCTFMSSGGSNQAPLDTPEELRAEPNVIKGRGNLGFNVCPAKPGGTEYLCDYRRRQLSETAGMKIDAFMYWPFDEGGCNCAKCRPWGGNGFPRLIERLDAVNKAAHPGAKTVVSTWVYADEDWPGLYSWLERRGGVDYILVDSHTDFPRYPLEHPVPRNIPVLTFPEISMWGRAVWGGYGATMMPRRFSRLFRQAEPVSGGFMCYSEGLYEDVNKEVVVGLYVNPETDTGDILRSYASYWFAGADSEDFVRLCDILEANHKFPGNHSHVRFDDVPEDGEEMSAYRRRASEACAIAERMDSAMLPGLRGSWRWRLVLLRTLIDREIFNRREEAPESARPYFDELVRIYHAEKQLDIWRRTGKGGYTVPHYPASTGKAKIAAAWEHGEPVTTYWFGPGCPGTNSVAMTDAWAAQLKEGGFNTIWARRPEDLDIAARHELRAIYCIDPGTEWAKVDLDDQAQRDALAERVNRVKDHPALYIYEHYDEASAELFPELARVREFVNSLDPAHAMWHNLLPTYASHRQLGVGGKAGELPLMGFPGDKIASYWEHVRLFCDIYQPELITYDHYQFKVNGDSRKYFLNLGLIQQAAAARGVPFWNGLQACTWVPGNLASPKSPRIPNVDEMRYLAHTTAAYGANGLYWYVYCRRRHDGTIASLDGTTGEKFEGVKKINREFVAFSRVLGGLAFKGAFMQGVHATGTTPFGAQALLKITPETPRTEIRELQRLEDTTLVTRFEDRCRGSAPRTYLMVVNCDYRKDRALHVAAPFDVDLFDSKTETWSAVGKDFNLDMIRGGGVLLRSSAQ